MVSLVNIEVKAEDGVSSDSIKFGQTAALGGEVRDLGLGMRDGILAAFKEVNDKGGIRGKKLELISYNDNYEPGPAINNAKKLIMDDKVFAMLGIVGTPMAKAIEPITSEAKIPMIGSFTGAEFLSNPFKPYVVNIRSSYYQETESWIKHLTEDKNIKKIAVLYQDDAFGQAGLEGIKIAVAKRNNIEIVATDTYERNTMEISWALQTIQKSNPEAILMVGAYKPCAKFIKTAKSKNMNPIFINISFVGESLVRELGSLSTGLVITQVVPLPFDPSVAVVSDYQKSLKAQNSSAEFGFVSLEGYINARLAIEVLNHIDGDITRESFINTLYKVGKFDLGGFSLEYGTQNNRGSSKVFVSIVDDHGNFKYYDKLQ
jgi:ABC-type branched-subunit amino acid transport system substrate-binding protein